MEGLAASQKLLLLLCLAAVLLGPALRRSSLAGLGLLLRPAAGPLRQNIIAEDVPRGDRVRWYGHGLIHLGDPRPALDQTHFAGCYSRLEVGDLPPLPLGSRQQLLLLGEFLA